MSKNIVYLQQRVFSNIQQIALYTNILISGLLYIQSASKQVISGKYKSQNNFT